MKTTADLTISLGLPRAESEQGHGMLQWHVYAHTEVASRMQYLEPGLISKATSIVQGVDLLVLSHTAAACKLLQWFMQRYTYEISEEDLDEMTRAVEAGHARDQRLVAFEATKTADPPLCLLTEYDLYDYQKEPVNMALAVRSFLLADDLGAGKTEMGLAVSALPDALPALILAPGGLMRQWGERIDKFIPGMTWTILNGTTPYPVKPVDYYITAYTRVQGWLDWMLAMEFKTLVLDEVHRLRRPESMRHKSTLSVSKDVKARDGYCLGLSASPVFNYADDIYHVLNVISPGCLGSHTDFLKAWTNGSVRARSISNPKGLGESLRKQGLLMRRTREELGHTVGKCIIDVVTIDASLEELQKFEQEAIKLATTAVMGSFTEAGEAAREFSTKLRKATGRAKAPAAAEFIVNLLENGREKVLVAAHHHDVYDMLASALAEEGYTVVFHTGRESESQKHANKKAFIEDDSVRVMVLSIEGVEGLDGLQDVCYTGVIVEPTWAPAQHAQFFGRLDRQRQTKPVYGYFLMVEDGSDPPMRDLLGLKKQMRDGIVDMVDPGAQQTVVAPAAGGAMAMAARYLEMKKVTAFGAEKDVKPSAKAAGIAAWIGAQNLATMSESMLHDHLAVLFAELLLNEGIETSHEAKLSDTCRIDFLVDGTIGVEVKVQGDRSEVYRQLTRYAEHVKELILVCPWPLPNMVVDGVYCHVVCYNNQASRLT